MIFLLIQELHGAGLLVPWPWSGHTYLYLTDIMTVRDKDLLQAE